MPLLPYKSSNWNTHNEVSLREMDFPLFEGDPTHFVLTRTYQGPRETFVPIALDTVDAIYNGTATGITGTAATDEVVFAASKKFLTGDPVLLAVTSGLAGLTDATTYYLIRSSDTTFKLASSRANAIAGTAINITSDGTGTLTPPIAYLVAHSKLSDGDADQVKYSRTFATIPASWSEPTSIAYTFPGYSAGAIGSAKGCNGITASGANTIFTLSASGDAVANDSVFVSVAYTRNGVVQTAQFTAKAIATTNTSQVTVARQLPGSGAFSSVSGSVTKAVTGVPAARSLPDIDARLLHEYALSAAPVAAPVFAPITAAGDVAEMLTSSTVPTDAIYRGYVLARTELVAGSSPARYMGNIFERRTRLVPAQ